MKVLIVATGIRDVTSEEFGERPPLFLLPLIDRPFIQHIVEYVAGTGVAGHIDIVLNHQPETVEALLGDGARWGLQFDYHLTRDPARPYGMLPTLSANGEPVLLIHADCLPSVPLAECDGTLKAVAFCDSGVWTGWAVLSPAALADISGTWTREQLEQWILRSARENGAVQECQVVLGVRTEAELIASQQKSLEKRFPGLMFYGREVEEGVWIARNVSVHPTASFVPPVYLGENSRIGPGIRVGPNAVVVRDSVVDRGTTLTHCAILPGSYVGQELELDHVIVDRNRLINVKAGGEIIVRDDFILSGITPRSIRSTLTGLLSRVSALLLLLLTWPALLITALALYCFRSGPVLRTASVVRLPASDDPWGWQTFEFTTFASPDVTPSALGHFFLRFLPGLISVLRGRLRLVGVEPRTSEELQRLPHDWRVLHLRACAGLVTEAFVNYGYGASGDEVYSSEAFYSVAAGPRHDLAILLRYVTRMFQLRPQPQTSDLDINLDPK